MDQLLFLLNKRHANSIADNVLDEQHDVPFNRQRSPSPTKRGLGMRSSRDSISFTGDKNREDISIISENQGNITMTTTGSSRHGQHRRGGVPSKLDSSLLANTGRTRHNRSPPSYKYVSPFVIQANLKAKQRSRQAVSRLRSQKENYRDGRLTKKMNDLEWTMDTKSNGLFDPKLQKKEIFRLEPRNQRNKENKEPRIVQIKNNLENGIAFKPMALDRNKLTMKPKLDTSPSLAMRMQNMRKSSSLSSSTSSDIADSSRGIRGSPASPLRRSIESARSSGNVSVSSGDIGAARSESPQLHVAPSPRSSMSAKRLWDQPKKKEKKMTTSWTGSSEGEGVEVVSRSTSPIDERVVGLLIHGLDDEDSNYNGNHHNTGFREPFNMQSQSQTQTLVQAQGQGQADMMASMARLMDAVGNIVYGAVAAVQTSSSASSQLQSQSYYYPRKLKAPRPGSAPNKLLSPSSFSSSSSSSAMPVARAEDRLSHAITKHRELAAERKQILCQAGPRAREAWNIDDTNNNIAPTTVPLTKTAVMDLLFSKLQAAEEHERDTRLLLEKSRKNLHRYAPANALEAVSKDPAQHLSDNSFNVLPSTSATKLPTTSVGHLLSSSSSESSMHQYQYHEYHHHEYASTSIKDMAETAPELLVVLDKRLTRESRLVSAEEQERRLAQEKTNASLRRYPALTVDRPLVVSIMQYKQQLQEATRLRSAAFLSRGVGLSDVVQSVSKSMVEHALQQVAGEVEGFVSEMADHLISKV